MPTTRFAWRNERGRSAGTPGLAIRESASMARQKTKKPKLVLRLYVAGRAPNSLRAIANAKAICEANFAADYAIETIDLLKNPRRALADGVIVTPTLIKVAP